MSEWFTYSFGKYELRMEDGRPAWLSHPDRTINRRGNVLALLAILLEGTYRGLEIVRRQDILRTMWPASDGDIANRSLDVYVDRLKDVLQDDKSLVEVVRGVGIRFRGPVRRSEGRSAEPRAAGPKTFVIKRTANANAIFETLLRAISADVGDGDVSSLECFERWCKNQNVFYRALIERPSLSSPRMMGFYSIHPLTAEAYELLTLAGLHYDSIGDRHIVNYGGFDLSGPNPRPSLKPKNGTCLFILDFELVRTARSLEAAPAYLLCDFAEVLRRWVLGDSSVKTIATLAATDAGRNYAERLGFSEDTRIELPQGNGLWHIYHMTRGQFLSLMTPVVKTSDSVKALSDTVTSSYELTEQGMGLMRTAFSDIAKNTSRSVAKKQYP